MFLFANRLRIVCCLNSFVRIDATRRFGRSSQPCRNLTFHISVIYYSLLLTLFYFNYYSLASPVLFFNLVPLFAYKIPRIEFYYETVINTSTLLQVNVINELISHLIWKSRKISRKSCRSCKTLRREKKLVAYSLEKCQ